MSDQGRDPTAPPPGRPGHAPAPGNAAGSRRARGRPPAKIPAANTSNTSEGASYPPDHPAAPAKTGGRDDNTIRHPRIGEPAIVSITEQQYNQAVDALATMITSWQQERR